MVDTTNPVFSDPDYGVSAIDDGPSLSQPFTDTGAWDDAPVEQPTAEAPQPAAPVAPPRPSEEKSTLLVKGVLAGGSLLLLVLIVGWLLGWFGGGDPALPAVVAASAAPAPAPAPSAAPQARPQEPIAVVAQAPRGEPRKPEPEKQESAKAETPKPPEAGSGKESTLPDDVAQWKKEDYFRARQENNPKLLPAIAYLGEKVHGSEPAAQGLAELLKPLPSPPASAQAPKAAAGAGTAADLAKRVGTTVAALGNNGSEFARSILEQILAGTFTTDDDTVAVEVALETLAAHPCVENDALMLRAITAPEALRSAERQGPWPARDLRARALDLVRPVASAELRTKLAEAVANRFAKLDARDPIREFLIAGNPLNCGAQIVLYENPTMSKEIRSRLEQQFADYGSLAMDCLMGLTVRARPIPAGPALAGLAPPSAAEAARRIQDDADRERVRKAQEEALRERLRKAQEEAAAREQGRNEQAGDEERGRAQALQREAALEGGRREDAARRDREAKAKRLAGRIKENDQYLARDEAARARAAQEEAARQAVPTAQEPARGPARKEIPPVVVLPPTVVDPDQAARLASQVWSAEFRAVLDPQLEKLGSLDRQAPLVVLAGTIPLESTRAALAKVLKKRWNDGPRTLEAAGLLDPLITDPGLLVLIKMNIPRKEPKVVKTPTGRGGYESGPPEDRRGGDRSGKQQSEAVKQALEKKKREDDAKDDWGSACSKLVQTWCKRLNTVATLRDKMAAEAGQPVDAVPKLPSNFELDAGARVVVAYHGLWPDETPAALSENKPGSLEVFYIRAEETNKPKRVIAGYQKQARIKPTELRTLDKGVWIDSWRAIPQNDRRRSLDVLVARRTDKAEDITKDDEEEDLVVEVLAIEISNPITRE